MNTNFIRNIKNFERIVTYCNGQPMGRELPQVASQDEIVGQIATNRVLNH